MIDISRYDCDFTMEEQVEASKKHFAYLENVHGEDRMAERLTDNTPFGNFIYDPIDTVEDYSAVNLQKLIDKLAHYEDLEEQGRLVVLAEGYDKECLCDALRTWEKALKGGAEDVSRGNDGKAAKA